MRRVVRFAEYQWRVNPIPVVVALGLRGLASATVGFVLFYFYDWTLVALAVQMYPLAWYSLWLHRTAPTLPTDPLPATVECLTDRLEIRRLDHSDAAAFASSIDSVMQEANGWPPGHRELSVSGVANERDYVSRRGQLVACDRQTGEPAVFLQLSDVELGSGRWTIGLWTTPAARGQGLATEALCGALEIVHEAGIEVVYIGTSVDNRAMRAVVERAGATLLDTRPHTLPDGSRVSSTWYQHGAQSKADAPEPH